MEETLHPASPETTPDTPQTPVPPAQQPLLEADDAKQIVENLLFITDRPLKPSRIAEVVETVNAKRVLEIIQELAKEYDGKIVVGKCDVEENDDIAMEFGIRNIPTILFIKDGKVVDKFVGATTKAKLQEKFEKLL